jgi:DNA-binding NarL/FixJ family response regulator
VAILATEWDRDAVVRILDAGGTGFLTKEYRLEGLIDAVRAVHGGEIVIPGDMVTPLIGSLLERRNGHHDDPGDVRRLTNREREVLGLLVRGAGNRAIADALGISPQTARTHVQNLLGKLGVHSRLEAAALAIQDGLVRDLEPV